MISQQILSSKCLLTGLALSLFSVGAFANGDPASFLKFSTDFDAKCVVRGGVMIYISNTHSTGKLKFCWKDGIWIIELRIEEDQF